MLNLVKFFILIKWVQIMNPKYWKVETGVILAQAYHETGNFTSNIFKVNKNLFGMKLATKRPTTATGESSGHATYKSYLDSIKDYFLRQENFKLLNPTSVTDYIESTANSGYATDGSYITKWTAIYNQIKGSLGKIKIAAAVIILLPFGAVIYGAYRIFTKKKLTLAKS